MAKHKFASISLTVRDRAISLKFSTHRVSEQCTLGNFQKKFSPPQNWRPFSPKMAKHKFASFSLSVRDRAISSKFYDRQGISKMYSWQFSKNFPLPKMAAILNFRIFAKMAKHKFASISSTV